MSLIERWKAALEESKNSWKNKVVKEVPVKNNQKTLNLHKLQLEKTIQNADKQLNFLNNENENTMKNRENLIVEKHEKNQRLPLSVNMNRQNHVNNVLNENKVFENKLFENKFIKSKKSSEEIQSLLPLSTHKKNEEINTETYLNAIKNNNLKETENLKKTNTNLSNEEFDKQQSHLNANLLTHPKKLILSRPLITKRLPTRYIPKVNQSVNKNNHELIYENFNKKFSDDSDELYYVEKNKNSINDNDLNKNKLNDLNQSLKRKSVLQNDENKETIVEIEQKLSQDNFQTPIIGQKNCGVKLRQVNTSNMFPNVMLVQFQGCKPLNIRLISLELFYIQQKFSSEFGSYLLITRNRLIIWYSNNVNVFEKSKASQMAYDILANKELLCNATKVEIANDDRLIMLAFKQIITKLDKNNIFEKLTSNSPLNLNDEYVKSLNQIKFYAEDVIYCVEKNNDELKIKKVANGIPATTKFFDVSEVLIFDFVTEIYIWVGQQADRSFVSAALKFAENLKKLPLNQNQCEIFGIFNFNKNTRPNWTIIRKQSQGIADCLFRFKFEKYIEKIFELHLNTTKSYLISPSPNQKKCLIERPFSVPVAATFNQILPNSMSNQISSLCSDNAYFGILKDEEKLIDDLAAKLGRKPEPKRQILQLESAELCVNDENLFSEKILFYFLDEEGNLKMFNNEFFEFEDEKCYVIEWHYRVERPGIRRLKNDKTLTHDTGRQRIAYFNWLGLHSSIKDRSRCALALRNFDKERHEHIRIEQGHEPPLFLHILNGKMIVSGRNSKWFLIIGSQDNLFSAEELSLPIEFRSQGVYLHLQEENLTKKQVKCFYGKDSSQESLNGALKLSKQLALSRKAQFDEKPIKIKEIINDLNLCIKCPKNWTGMAPRFYRIYGYEGEELIFERYDTGVNFTFRQSDLKDCVLIEQTHHLWIWSENIVRTFELKVANKIWYDIKQKNVKDATVINKGYEPDEFCALFPTWNSFQNLNLNNNNEEENKLKKPQLLEELLYERTRYRTPEELRLRKLPKGCDTKHLEQYLNETDFQEIFNCNKNDYNKLPRWKQISLKKKADLF